MRLLSLVSSVAILALTGCLYDSSHTNAKVAQQQSFAETAPSTLEATRPDPKTSPPRRVRSVRVRALVSPTFTAHVVDTRRWLRELLDEANRVAEPSLGIQFELESTREWSPTTEESVDAALSALRSADPGDGTEWVAGFIGAVPRMGNSFHQLGMGELVGKHLVMRAPGSAAAHDGIHAQYDRLAEDDVRRRELALKKHKAAVVFLHEIGHTLGAVHEADKASIMHAEYLPAVTSFGENALTVMRTALEHREESPNALFRSVRASLAAAHGTFIDALRDELVANLDQRIAATTAPTPGSAPPALTAPETPNLSAADRARFVKAFELDASGDSVGAWKVAEPLFTAYPKSLPVQDLRCQMAQRVGLSFPAVRHECDALMKLSTAASPAK